MARTYNIPTGDFVSTTLSGALAAAATTATIGTGLTIPATNGVLQIDYDSTTAAGSDNGPETVKYATYTTGTGALTGLTRGIDGETSDVAHANGAKVHAAASSVFGKNFCGAKAYLTSTLGTTVDNTVTKILLDGESYDVGANFASNKFTAPVNGYYAIDAAVQFGSTIADKQEGAVVQIDGATVLESFDTSGSLTLITINISDVVYMAANSYVELNYFHNSGATTPDINGGSEKTYLTVHLISEA